MQSWRWVLLALLIGVQVPRARAVDIGEGKLTVNAFGQEGYGRTSNENAYDVGSEEGRYENAQFSLAISSRPTDDIVVAGQIFVNAEGEFSLDWGFAEYRIHDLLRLRAGKMKNPFGIFMEVKDVGTLRPFFSLPYSIYGAGNMASEAYLGAGLTGAWSGDAGWRIAYDLYFGALSAQLWNPGQAVIDGTTPFVFGEPEEVEVRDVVGARLVLGTPVEGLSFTASGYSGNAPVEGTDATERMTVGGLSAEWAREAVQLRGEIFHQRIGEEQSNLAGYVEAAWRFLPKLQASVRFERARLWMEGLDPKSSLRDHTEGALGLGFWPSEGLAFKGSWHLVKGNRFALPEESADGEVEERTSLLVAGVQFSF